MGVYCPSERFDNGALTAFFPLDAWPSPLHTHAIAGTVIHQSVRPIRTLFRTTQTAPWTGNAARPLISASVDGLGTDLTTENKRMPPIPPLHSPSNDSHPPFPQTLELHRAFNTSRAQFVRWLHFSLYVTRDTCHKSIPTLPSLPRIASGLVSRGRAGPTRSVGRIVPKPYSSFPVSQANSSGFVTTRLTVIGMHSTQGSTHGSSSFLSPGCPTLKNGDTEPLLHVCRADTFFPTI